VIVPELEYDIQVVLTLSDFADDPDRLTERLGVLPTRAAKKGSRNPKLIVPRSNLWMLRSKPAEPTAGLAEHWNDIMLQLEGKERALRVVAEEGDAVFTVIFSPNHSGHAVSFSREIVEFVARCGSRLEVD
jgi:uncharacterized protein DUF4279